MFPHLTCRTARTLCINRAAFFLLPLRVSHSRARWQSNSAIQTPSALPESTTLKTSHALARLPLSSIIRSLLLGAFFTSPLLSKPGIAILGVIAQSRSVLLNPDKNFLVKAAIKLLIYNHFCAGTTKAEIQNTASKFKGMGYSGILLCYGKEFDPTKEHKTPSGEITTHRIDVDTDVQNWERGNLETLDMLQGDDFLQMKYTGAGQSVIDALVEGSEPPKPFATAMGRIIDRALAQNARIFVDAEHDKFQHTIDRWTIDLMRRHNRNGKMLIYNTIQAYLKNARQKVEHHLQLAHTEGWTLAFKLVRGAYIAQDPRHIIHDTKDQTDDCYNSITRDLLTSNMPGIPRSEFPSIGLLLAGHNTESVEKATSLVRELARKGTLRTVPEFGQLQGMSDSLGCRILQDSEAMNKELASMGKRVVSLKVYKATPWGSVQECMQYLIRRAVENRAATERMRDGMRELAAELRRRIVGRLWRR